MLVASDFILLAVLVLLSLSIGVYQSCTGGRQRTRAEFILNNRQLKILPTLLSFVVSYQSSISIMYAPAEYYKWGTQMWFGIELFGCLAIIIVERYVVPHFYKLQITSIFELFELRYRSKAVRYLCSVYFVINACTYMGTCILGPAVALETITGIPVGAGILLMVGCCAIYTAIGGIRAVVWTDVLQCIIMVGGLCVLLIGAYSTLGGLGDMLQVGRDHGRIFFAQYDLDPRIRGTLWSNIAHGFFGGLSSFGYTQPAMQRYTSMPILGKARLLMLLNVPGVMLYISLCYFVGAAVFAYFDHEKCDPFKGGLLTSSHQLLPFYVKSFFKNTPGVRGLFLAVLYSASLSSASSYLSACATVLWEDFFKTCFPNVSERKAALGVKVLVLVVAVCFAGCSFLAFHLPGNLFEIASTLGGSVLGPSRALFLLATFNARVEWKGALTGCILGTILTAWISFGSIFTPSVSTPLPPLDTYGCSKFNNVSFKIDEVAFNASESAHETSYNLVGVQNIYAISWQWYSFIGLVTTCIIAICVSELVHKFEKQSQQTSTTIEVVSFKNICNVDGWPELWKDLFGKSQDCASKKEEGTNAADKHNANGEDLEQQSGALLKQ